MGKHYGQHQTDETARVAVCGTPQERVIHGEMRNSSEGELLEIIRFPKGKGTGKKFLSEFNAKQEGGNYQNQLDLLTSIYIDAVFLDYDEDSDDIKVAAKEATNALMLHGTTPKDFYEESMSEELKDKVQKLAGLLE